MSDNINILENHNLKYYSSKNIEFENYSFDELQKLYRTFANIIISNNDIDNIDFSLETRNTLYKLVLNYYNNYKQDDASINISLVLGTTIQYNTSGTYTSCGCNTQQNGELSSISCFDSYTNGMQLLLKEMLGNTAFYNDWFFVQDNEEKKVNDVMIDKLILLLNEFIEKNTELSITSNNTNNCVCHNDNNLINTDNIQIIKNYIKLLGYIKNCTIIENKNKIKVYGEAFAELLPNLDF